MAPFLALLGLVALVFAGALQWQRRRARTLSALAAELGFAYAARHPGLEAMLPGVARFGELSRRHGAWNAMRGVWQGTELLVFDHGLLQSSGPGAERTRSTALFQAGDADLPDFEMRPESLGTRIGSALTGGDIDLPDAPWLDARISLRGRPRDAVRDFFSGARARALRRQPLKLAARSGDGWLAVYRSGPLVRAEEIKAFLDEAVALAQILISPTAGDPPPPPS